MVQVSHYTYQRTSGSIFLEDQNNQYMLRLLSICTVLLLCSSTLLGQKAPSSKTPVDPDKVIIKKQRTRNDKIVDSLYQARISLDKIDGIYIPRDLYDTFKELDKLMDEDAKAAFMAFSDAEVDRRTHGTLGVWIEHKWSMAEGSRLSEYFRKMKVPHYDYMIGIIIQSYHRHLHQRDLDIKGQVIRFRALWQQKQKEKADRMLMKGTVQK